MEFLGRSTQDITRAADHLLAGELVVWHSERYYGLSANGENSAAVERLYRAKGRAASEALVVHVLDLDDARRYGRISSVAERLAAAFWPGYLGLVVDKTDAVPDYVTSGLPTVLLACAGGLGHDLPAAARAMIVSSSANISGKPPATTLDQVRAFAAGAGDRIAAVVGDGPCPLQEPMTIVSTVTDPPKVLRKGLVKVAAVQDIVPETVVEERVEPGPTQAGSAMADQIRPGG